MNVILLVLVLLGISALVAMFLFCLAFVVGVCEELRIGGLYDWLDRFSARGAALVRWLRRDLPA